MNAILSPTANLKESLQDIVLDLPGRFPIARWAPIPLRLIVGFGFMEHGFAKLSRGPDAFATVLHALAVPAPHFMAWVTILTELLGGLAIFLGAFVSLISLPLASVLLVAIYCAFALRVQLDQAHSRDSSGCPVRARRLRMRSPISGLPRRPCLRWFWTACNRWSP
jgi:uncharacterized membrane protein